MVSARRSAALGGLGRPGAGTAGAAAAVAEGDRQMVGTGADRVAREPGAVQPRRLVAADDDPVVAGIPASFVDVRPAARTGVAEGLASSTDLGLMELACRA